MDTDSPATLNRHTETRHATPGNTCNHFQKYGLTCDEYDQLRARSEGRCELCRTPEVKTVRGALVIDHFEGGGVFFVRGLLCDRCNSVMSRHDRTAEWGPSSLPWESKAREYHLRAFGCPNPEEFALAEAYIAARKPYAVKDRVLPKPTRRTKVPYIRLDRSVPQIASKLRRHLDGEQLTKLIELLLKAR
jgi:hypothetical protein